MKTTKRSILVYVLCMLVMLAPAFSLAGQKVKKTKALGLERYQRNWERLTAGLR